MDVHRLAEVDATGKKLALRLAGVTVPHTKGAVAHSDGDVVIHALCDALLGAAALGDIGLHFPDSSEEFRGIDSRELLRQTCALVRAAGFEIGNVDCTVMLQVPRVRPFIDEMRRELATALGVEVGAVSVKATTTERLGFVGREEGVAAEAVVLICKSEQPPQPQLPLRAPQNPDARWWSP
jgi:2-C-methyl-D-erythritol 2,4-cyclodiphosphate synthase